MTGYNTANPKSYKYIKATRDELKDNPTKAEKVLWEYLKSKKTGFKIRRQHIRGDYIADFVCLSKNSIIEVDGTVHDSQKEHDTLRTEKLNELGYEVVRFTNEEVFQNPKKVFEEIKNLLEKRPTSTNEN